MSKFKFYAGGLLIMLCETWVVITGINTNRYMMAFFGFAFGMVTIGYIFGGPSK